MNTVQVEKLKKKIFLLILFIFSILFNQYYGYIGLLPLDSFLIFNSGYDVLNGYFPFKDYWTITGPLLDVIQAFFFKILGVSWFSYVLHASIFNFIIAFATFHTLNKFGLNINYCLFYSLLTSSLAYPIAGTPFMDHHSMILSLVALFSFILAIKTKNKLYWFLLPLLLGLAFLSKQTPAAYFGLIIGVLLCIHFFLNFNSKNILFFLLGVIFFLILFFLFFVINEIKLISFIEQYILFPQSLANSRLELLLPLEFNRIVLRFKLIHLSLILLIVIIVKKTLADRSYTKKNEFLILLSIIGTSFSLIIHQLMTLNAKFIFFIIPILVGFSHIYFEKYFNKKKYILYALIFLVTSSTIYYQYSYNNNRRFMDLNEINLNKAIDAKILDKKLNKLKWITRLYPDNPKKEISELKKAIKIIKNDDRKKIIVTDYQFISVILEVYDFSPNRFWHKGVGYPNKGDKYFNLYKKFFTEKLKKNKIKILYSVKPLYFENNFLNNIVSKKCIKKDSITDILDAYVILDCEELS